MSAFIPNYAEVYRENQRAESGLLGGIALLSMMACINCALPEMEMLLAGGRVPIPGAFLKAACFGLLLILMMLYGRLDLSSFPTTMWLVAVAYLLLDVPFLWFSQGKEPSEIFLSYNAGYCSLILAPLACAVRGKVPERLGLRIFLWAFAACALVGWAQFIFQTPVVRLVSTDGNFRIYASLWMQEGEVATIRAFSVFGSALEYGGFAVLIAAIAIGMCGKPGGWKFGVPLYLIAAASCYTTMTRVVFLQLAVATVAALTFTFGRSLRRMIWQPLIGLGVGGLLAFGGLPELMGQTKGLSDTASLELRLRQWEVYGEELMHSSLMQQLFGLGFSQADKPLIIPRRDDLLGKASTVLVDNLYLALTLHIGLVGMVVIIALLWAMWRHIRSETVKRPTPLLIGIASFWATFLMTGMFNCLGAIYGFWFLIGTMVLNRAGKVEVESPWSEVDPALEPEQVELVAP